MVSKWAGRELDFEFCAVWGCVEVLHAPGLRPNLTVWGQGGRDAEHVAASAELQVSSQQRDEGAGTALARTGEQPHSKIWAGLAVASIAWAVPGFGTGPPSNAQVR